MKIFDFGLGKEIPSSANTETPVTANGDKTPETWRLTAMVGTPRYSKFHTIVLKTEKEILMIHISTFVFASFAVVLFRL